MIDDKHLRRLADADTLICKNCGHADSRHGEGGCDGIQLDPPIQFCGCENFIADLGSYGLKPPPPLTVETVLKGICRHLSGVMKDGPHSGTCPDCGEVVR
jgi:hypothetical protein